ncbi:peptidase domain-containing ABC transporter [Lactococcus lactis]
MAKIYFQQQSEHSECGLACVAMLLDYFTIRTRLTELREHYGVPTGGYNLFQMSEVFAENNLNSRAVKADNEKLKTIKTPFIVFWNHKHFVIVEKMGSNTVNIIDPALGKLKISTSDFSENYSGYALYITDSRKKKRSPIKLNSKLVNCFKNNKYKLLGVVLISLLIQFFNLLIPFIMKNILDGKLVMSVNEMGIGFAIFSMIFILYFVTNMGKTRIITTLQTSFDSDLLSLTIHYLLGLPYSYFSNRSKGELIYRINSNSYVRQILVDNVIGSVTDLLFFIIYLVALFYTNILLAVVTLIISTVIVLFSIINARINQKLTQKQMVNLTKSQEITSELVNNIFTIKATNSQERFYENWISNFNKQIAIEKSKAKYSSILLNIPQSLQVFYSLIIIFIGYFLVIHHKMTIGSVIAFNTVGLAFLAPMMSIIGVYSQLLIVKVYIERLLDILDNPSEQSLFGNKEISKLLGNIRLSNVSYGYSKFSENTLSDVSLKISQYEKVAIVGPSGSGKSTLLQVIAGLYKSNIGSIEYDNMDIDDLNIQSLRGHLGIVLQDHNVFNGTIRDNITMGRHYEDQEIWKVLKDTELYEFVSKLPIGLDTYISESGNNISGGQSQKLSLARTIISKPNILLLDEPTSSLDNISEEKIMKKIFNMSATVIVVAHRLSTIESFDNIIVLNEGRIIEQGNHKQLLRTSQLYKNLYSKKRSENES